MSGLIAALSEDASEFCLEIARAAKKHGARISFDLNHRASFWRGREAELSAAFKEIASLSDILIGNEEDFQLCLDIEGPEAGGEDIGAKIDGFKEMIQRVKQEYGNASLFATTLREVESANSHMWGAIVSSGEDWHIVKPREIGVLDRIGGGDGFVGGLLYGVLKQWDAEKSTQFGWATGALAATMYTDYGQPADEDQVWSIWKGECQSSTLEGLRFGRHRNQDPLVLLSAVRTTFPTFSADRWGQRNPRWCIPKLDRSR